jgi:hypothetical protein
MERVAWSYVPSRVVPAFKIVEKSLNDVRLALRETGELGLAGMMVTSGPPPCGVSTKVDIVMWNEPASQAGESLRKVIRVPLPGVGVLGLGGLPQLVSSPTATPTVKLNATIRLSMSLALLLGQPVTSASRTSQLAEPSGTSSAWGHLSPWDTFLR